MGVRGADAVGGPQDRAAFGEGVVLDLLPLAPTPEPASRNVLSRAQLPVVGLQSSAGPARWTFTALRNKVTAGRGLPAATGCSQGPELSSPAGRRAEPRARFSAKGPKQTLGVSTEHIPELIKLGEVSPTGCRWGGRRGRSL